MADQHNSNIPAIANQISADIPDIKENLEFHKDAFQRIFETWSDTDNTSSKFNTAPGFNDGTYNYEFPTNGVAGNSVIMLGNSSTVIWMYLNTAPPGWKALSTGADTVLGVSGGSAAYNVNGGNPDSSATWTISGLSGPSHTHTMGTHNHQWFKDTGGTNARQSYASNGTATNLTGSATSGSNIALNETTRLSGDWYTANVDPGDTNSGGTGAVTSAGSWRAKASVGKLFQLDTA